MHEVQPYSVGSDSDSRIKQAACNIFYRQPRSFYAAEGIVFNAALLACGNENAGGYVGASSFIAAGGISILYKNWWRKVDLGEHMVVKPERFVNAKKVKLSDSTVVSPGDLVGRIHFGNNLLPLQNSKSLVTYTRDLYRSAEESLIDLAQLCKKDKHAVKDINVFWGRSHLVGRLTERLGFDTFPIRNPVVREWNKYWCKDVARAVAGTHEEWKRYEKNFRDPRDAYISREKLITIFGEKK